MKTPAHQGRKRSGPPPRFAAALAIAAAILFTIPWTPAATPRGEPAPPQITPAMGEFPLNARVNVIIRCEPGATVVYTLDGTTPGPYSGIHAKTNHVEIDLPQRDVVIRAAALLPGQPMSRVREARFTRK